VNGIQKGVFKSVAKASGSMTQPMFLQIGALNTAFYRKFGKETLPIIAECMGQSGTEAGESIRNRMGKAKSMRDISSMFEIVEAMLGIKMGRVEVTDSVFHCTMPKCPYGLEGTSKELCEAMMVKDAKQVSAVLGQEIKMEIVKSVAAGDKKCDIAFSI
jgi:hypothetical protein